MGKFYLNSVDETAKELETDVNNGLSVSQVEEKRKKYGFNELISTLRNYPGIIVQNDLENDEYPLATKANGYDNVFVRKN